GFLVVPGMVNAHNHSNENWFRGMWDNLPLEPWMLFSYPALAAPTQTPDEIYLRTLFGAIEQLKSGATCVVDFLYELDGFTRESRSVWARAGRSGARTRCWRAAPHWRKNSTSSCTSTFSRLACRPCRGGACTARRSSSTWTRSASSHRASASHMGSG